jgi:hypothetical protein
MRRIAMLLCFATVAAAACHPEPVLNTGPAQPPVGGTIAGIVTTTDSMIPVVDRKVTVTDARTGAHFETRLASNGGYTIQVPKGTYHIDIELHEGEALATRPEDTHINNGDLDPHRNFVITVRAR